MKTALALLLLTFAGAAAAQDAPPPAAADSGARSRLEPTAAERDAGIDRLCLRETGTLIRARRPARSNERCPSHQFGRVYTQDDLRSTGQADIAQALRMLDPSIR